MVCVQGCQGRQWDIQEELSQGRDIPEQQTSKVNELRRGRTSRDTPGVVPSVECVTTIKDTELFKTVRLN